MFGKFFKSGKNNAPQGAERLSGAITDSIISVVGSRGIPPMPGAAQRAFQLSTDPNADARDFIEVIESDEALSARVIKIANSVFFDRGTPSTTIEQSVVVIGILELRCLLNATTLSEIFPSKHPARTHLWIHDIATAIIAKSLAQRLAPQHADEAFLGGLMHDIGKLLLVQRVPEYYAKVLTQVEQGKTFIEAEEEVWAFNHCQVGQLVAERWHFTPELAAIIGGHHAKFPDRRNNRDPFPLPLLVACADTIAHALGCGHPRGFTTVRARALEGLPAVWGALQTSIVEQQRNELTRLERLVASEMSLYSSKVGG